MRRLAVNFSMYSDMSIWMSASAVAEHELGEVAGEEGLADAGGAEEEERADRAARVLEVGAASGAAPCEMAMTASSWPMTRPLSSSSILRSFSVSSCSMRLERDAGPLGDDGHDVVLGDDRRCFSSRVCAPVLRGCPRASAWRASRLSRRAAAFSKSWSLMAASFSTRICFDLRLDVLDLRRAGHRADAGAGAGLVHDVDRLVGQETAGEVAVG